MAGTLYIVSTPIGNLRDMTYRAVDVLKLADAIACEDTRRTGKLLKEFGIEGRLIGYHEHIEAEKAEEIGELLKAGGSVALVSDAGTPGIADPGFRAVNKALEIGASVVPVPGPAAFVTALSVSGLPTDAVFFGGFLPSKKGERIRRLSESRNIPATLVFYETPHRIEQSLEDCLEVLGDRDAALARELTKIHEECLRGSLSYILARVRSEPPKGEMVILIDRTAKAQSANRDRDLADVYEELLEKGVDPKRALKQAAKESGLSRSEAYRRLHIHDGEK
ncbi:MAG: 16S rRNA (cytidine(1402)-2'-O)-methyltransferase [Aridibacter famidurans]|nr:16S rRNA (cytidine(1402)-2'-O)-methyltransferase [Aridibacter famidurans]